ncbi:MAG: hypothetical protein Q9226_007081 [Calogaya cf. arnoldii]
MEGVYPEEARPASSCVLTRVEEAPPVEANQEVVETSGVHTPTAPVQPPVHATEPRALEVLQQQSPWLSPGVDDVPPEEDDIFTNVRSRQSSADQGLTWTPVNRIAHDEHSEPKLRTDHDGRRRSSDSCSPSSSPDVGSRPRPVRRRPPSEPPPEEEDLNLMQTSQGAEWCLSRLLGQI